MSVQSIEPLQEPRRLGIAFITALALHSAMAAAVTFWPHETDDPPGEQEITIDVAPALEEAPSVASAEVAAMEAPPVDPQEVLPEPEAVEPLPPDEVTAEQPEEVAKVSEREDVAEVPLAATELAAEPEPVVALPPPETVFAKPLENRPPPKRPERKPVEKPVERKPPPRRTVAETRPPSEARQGQASSSRENTQGSAASADPDVLRSYGARVRAALQSRFRIPDALRSQGFNGSATVSFTIDDSGRIISSSITGSSGHPAADQAALDAARLGSSVPPAPASVSQRRFIIRLVTKIR
ncbi:protein TonB [Microvirga lupini]|uniref:Protein TonB n=1 Tax=Microvirga lupini TaxID=420324 RepID=A0A7W4VHM2_9HYPH|nr:TonB family protein [Microvirga lupini]MBB3017366.1 protein TonB [Microvirga lupini]